MPAQFDFLNRTIAEFYQILETGLAGLWLPDISFFVKSIAKTEHYKWLGMTPMMRKWVGGRHPVGLRDEAYTLDNEKFEATLDFEVDDLNRGLGPQILVRIAELADSANDYIQFLASGAIDLGNSALCYDGQPFFDAAHPATGKAPAQKNLLVAGDVAALNVVTPTAPTPAEFVQAVLGCIAWMYGLKDDQGRPMNGSARNFMLMVPIGLWSAAAGPALVSLSSVGAIAGDNLLQVAAAKMGINIRTVVNPYLDWTTDFALFRTDGRAKPLIFQEEYPVRVSVKGPGSEYEHDTDRNQFGIKRSCNVGYGYWQFATKATLS